MLKSITRRRKKYIFLDYLIVLFTSLYLRIRTIDMDFYSSIQPNYLWLLTILFGLMFAKIGRVWCIFICVNLNLLSIYYFNNTNNIVFITSIYKLTYDSLILLVICHSFNIFRDKGFQVLTYCYAFGNYCEIAQIFINLKYFKYFLFILIISLSFIRLRCRQLQQTNYFIVIKRLCTIRMAIIQIIILLYVLLTSINIYTFIDTFTSSLTRYIIIFIYPMYLLPLLHKFQYINEAILVVNVVVSALLIFDQLMVFFLASLFIPLIFIAQFGLFIYAFEEIDPIISRIYKHLNYDPIVLIHYIILKYSNSNYESYSQHKNIIYFLCTIVAIFIFIKNKNICKNFTNKQNYYKNTYDQFESARNDDTVL